jgi:hypothetical protein
MKTPVEIFDEWIIAANGQLAPRLSPIPAEIAPPFVDQLKRFQIRIEEVRRYFSPGRNIEIYADFLDNGTCNAAAGVFGKMGLIGINKGAIMLPFELFQRMFSHPLVMFGLGGDFPKEKRGPQHGEGIPDDYDTLIAARKRAGRKPLPKPPINPVRRAVALMCIDLAWGFLMNHELIHIIHGHVEYLQNTQAIPLLLEISPSHPSVVLSSSDLDYQTIELWADSKAAEIVLGGLFSKSYGPTLETHFGDVERKLFLWGFTMFALFRVWGFRMDPLKLHGELHPPTIVRFQLLMAQASIQIAKLFPELGDQKFYAASHAGQLEAERGIRYSGGPAVAAEDITASHDPNVDDLLKQLISHFENHLWKELEKYAYVPLRTP